MRGAAAAEPDPDQNLAAFLRRRIIGQDEAINAIAPYVQLFQSGLAPAGRPAGVFLLLGPTGTGKTRTVEALAEALHGHERHILRVDCGEFQLDHEVAKLIGAPPGYLGHRET
ncbi:MAG TPA: ATPase, partial [Solibacterales bacterium]|nr:ATPase [Bryobacterales bacterium]